MCMFSNAKGRAIVLAIIAAIQKNKDYLSQIDGLIGDGDHGINMNKGATLAEERIRAGAGNMSDAFETLGATLMNEIGGAMGPLYGVFFSELAAGSQGQEQIDAKGLGRMLRQAMEKVAEIGGAQPGDKTLMDCLAPAVRAYEDALQAGASFEDALTRLSAAAEAGRDSTKDMRARKGRASRLGDRSIGTLDAGATSCCVILQALSAAALDCLRGTSTVGE